MLLLSRSWCSWRAWWSRGYVHGDPGCARHHRKLPRHPSRSCSTPTTSTRCTIARSCVRLLALSRFLATVFDLGLIDGLVNAVGAPSSRARRTRRLQTGYTVNYALTMLAGAVAIAAFLLRPIK